MSTTTRSKVDEKAEKLFHEEMDNAVKGWVVAGALCLVVGGLIGMTIEGAEKRAKRRAWKEWKPAERVDQVDE